VATKDLLELKEKIQKIQDDLSGEAE